MTEEQLERIRTGFLAFVEGFRDPAADLAPGLALKLEHTRRVAGHARDIARELGWSPEDVRMAEALGWLHDVGRFVQFAEFGHFHDASSFNHGQRGADVVEQSGMIAGLRAARRRCLLAAIRHHNAKTIPPAISRNCRPFLKLIRDADKLDIFRVVIEELERDGFRELADMWPHVALDGPVNPLLQREIRERRHGDVAHVRSLADFLLIEASWIYDLQYAPTRERVRRNGALEALAAYLPDDPATREILDDVRQVLAGHPPADSSARPAGRTARRPKRPHAPEPPP